MSDDAVAEFFDRLENDEAFAQQIADLREDPAAVQAAITAAGFEVNPEDVREAFLERYGSMLSEEQLAAVAGGLSNGEVIGVAVAGAGLGLIGVVAIAAAAI